MDLPLYNLKLKVKRKIIIKIMGIINNKMKKKKMKRMIKIMMTIKWKKKIEILNSLQNLPKLIYFLIT
jgi:hypothetical protein